MKHKHIFQFVKEIVKRESVDFKPGTYFVGEIPTFDKVIGYLFVCECGKTKEVKQEIKILEERK